MVRCVVLLYGELPIIALLRVLNQSCPDACPQRSDIEKLIMLFNELRWSDPGIPVYPR